MELTNNSVYEKLKNAICCFWICNQWFGDCFCNMTQFQIMDFISVWLGIEIARWLTLNIRLYSTIRKFIYYLLTFNICVCSALSNYGSKWIPLSVHAWNQVNKGKQRRKQDVNTSKQFSQVKTQSVHAQSIMLALKLVHTALIKKGNYSASNFQKSPLEIKTIFFNYKNKAKKDLISVIEKLNL